MSAFELYQFSPEDFSGTARLFPVPNLIMFPHVMQPLHVFEPRYCDLLADALADDGLIAMAVFAPGWEDDYQGRPPLGPVACLGRIAVAHASDDGTHNVLLAGLCRVRLLAELPPMTSFRQAEVELGEDVYTSESATMSSDLWHQLHEAIARLLPHLPQVREPLEQLLASDVPLGVLTDVISYMLDLGIPEKEALLGEYDVHRRAALLLGHLTAAASDQAAGPLGLAVFPPDFSDN